VWPARQRYASRFGDYRGQGKENQMKFVMAELSARERYKILVSTATPRSIPRVDGGGSLI
jgi:hypothetical protein